MVKRLRRVKVLLAAWISGVAWCSFAQSPPPATAPATRAASGLLFNFLHDDPSDEIIAACALSEPQASHIKGAYATYREAALALARKCLDRVTKEGSVDENRRLGSESSPELRLAARQSAHEARQSIKAENLAIEQAYIDAMATVISDAQRPAFERAIGAIVRRTWLDFGQSVQQDFLQFGDPLASLYEEREALAAHADVLKDFDAVLQQFEIDLTTRIRLLQLGLRESRGEYRIEQARGDETKLRVAFRRSINAWNALYSALDQASRAGVTAMEGAGFAEPARHAREAFWQACFPDLFGNELVPTLFRVILEVHPELNDEQRQAVEALRSTYLAQRHVLLRTAVTDHVRDYLKIADADERRLRLMLDSLGASSESVSQAQVERCRLGMRTQDSIKSLIGSLDKAMAHAEVIEIKARDKIIFETPGIEQYLVEKVTEYQSGQPIVER